MKKLFEDYVCADIPNAFLERKQQMVELPCEKDFDERNIPTKACPLQMNTELQNFAKNKFNLC